MQPSGALFQLVAVGGNNRFFTHFNASPSVFDNSRQKKTNFAPDTQEIQFTNNPDFNKTVTCQIPTYGDLLSTMFLKVTLPKLDTKKGYFVSWVRNIGHFLIDRISVKLNGTIIESHSGEYLHINNQLCYKEDTDAYRQLIGDLVSLSCPSLEIQESTIYIPLQFFFCKKPVLLPIAGSSNVLPMLQKYEIEVKFSSLEKCIEGRLMNYDEDTHIISSSLYVDYMCLDNEERKELYSKEQLYNITPINETIFHSKDNFYDEGIIECKLSSNRIVSELIFIISKDNKMIFDEPTISKVSLILNGEYTRNGIQNADFFNVLEPYKIYNKIPPCGIHLFSFSGMNPDISQGAGTLNFDRIEKVALRITTKISGPFKVHIFEKSINVLSTTRGLLIN